MSTQSEVMRSTQENGNEVKYSIIVIEQIRIIVIQAQIFETNPNFAHTMEYNQLLLTLSLLKSYTMLKIVVPSNF